MVMVRQLLHSIWYPHTCDKPRANAKPESSGVLVTKSHLRSIQRIATAEYETVPPNGDLSPSHQEYGRK